MAEEVRGQTMCAAFVDGLMVVVHGADNPAQGEWEEYCELAGSLRERRGYLRTVVVAEGSAAPNALQRGIYKDKVASTNNRVAVLTESSAARAVLTAMSWFNREMKGFPLNGLRAALDYLEVPETQKLHQTIEEMRTHLDLTPLPKTAGG